MIDPPRSVAQRAVKATAQYNSQSLHAQEVREQGANDGYGSIAGSPGHAGSPGRAWLWPFWWVLLCVVVLTLPIMAAVMRTEVSEFRCRRPLQLPPLHIPFLFSTREPSDSSWHRDDLACTLSLCLQPSNAPEVCQLRGRRGRGG